MLNDKPLISPGIYVNHVPGAGRSRALHSEKYCLIGKVWILFACLVSGALGLPAAFSGWAINEADDKVEDEEQRGGDRGHGLELRPTPNSIQTAFSFLFSAPRSAGPVIAGLLQGSHPSRLC